MGLEKCFAPALTSCSRRDAGNFSSWPPLNFASSIGVCCRFDFSSTTLIECLLPMALHAETVAPLDDTLDDAVVRAKRNKMIVATF